MVRAGTEHWVNIALVVGCRWHSYKLESSALNINTHFNTHSYSSTNISEEFINKTSYPLNLDKSSVHLVRIIIRLNAAIIAVILLTVVLINGHKWRISNRGKDWSSNYPRLVSFHRASNHVTSLFQTLLLWGLISQLYIKHKSKPNFLRMK